MIRYLEQDEKLKARAMYETCFPEDDQAFVDYYFTEKIRDNRILVMEEEKKLQVMIHLNPFTFSMGREPVKVNYVVAVATDAKVRKQGKMAGVMGYALQDMAKGHQPFTFLIPANPRVYESCGFAFISCENYGDYEKLLSKHKSQSLRAAQMQEIELPVVTMRPATEQDITTMISFSNNFLEQEYDIFPRRNEAYYQRMIKELQSQKGALMLLEQGDNTVGILSYGTYGNQMELQEILLQPKIREQFADIIGSSFPELDVEISSMEFMARILDLQEMVSLLRCEEPFSLQVQVQDSVIEKNNGCFKIAADKKGGNITEILSHEVDCVMDISKLTQVLFAKMRMYVREWV